MPEPADPTTRIQDAILAALLEGRAVTVRTVARSSGMSMRTLQRHLRARETSFSRLLREARARTACRLLEEARLPVGAIAARLGYSETSSFTRAFRHWTGTSPTTYRSLVSRRAHVR